MGQGIVIVGTMLVMVVLGLTAPFVFGLAYLWVDVFTPQLVIPYVVRAIGLPVAATMAIGAFAAYAAFDRKHPPPLLLFFVLMAAWIAWFSWTTTRAVLPEAAWWRWDLAFKTAVFATFLPFLFRSRVQIEAAYLTLAFAASGSIVAAAIKSFVTGGNYEVSLALTPVNIGQLGESSILATVAVATIPIAYAFSRSSVLLPPGPATRAGLYGLMVCCVAAAIGSFSRTGLLVLGVLAAFTWLYSKRKLMIGVACVAAFAVLFAAAGEKYMSRISTIKDPRAERSAATRLWVWDWTIKFARANPAGGGFEVYRINEPMLTEPDGETVTYLRPRAYHNMFLQVLGEQGYPGMLIYLGIMGWFFATLIRLIRRTRAIAELLWMNTLAKASVVSGVITLVGGSFVNTAYDPFLFYQIALAACLLIHYRRCTAAVPASVAATRVAGVRGRPVRVPAAERLRNARQAG